MKTYLATPIVKTEEYQTMGEVLPLLDAGTHKVKVQEGNTVVGKLKLKEEDCLIDGKVVRVKKGKIKKNNRFQISGLPKFRLPAFESPKTPILICVFGAGLSFWVASGSVIFPAAIVIVCYYVCRVKN